MEWFWAGVDVVTLLIVDDLGTDLRVFPDTNNWSLQAALMRGGQTNEHAQITNRYPSSYLNGDLGESRWSEISWFQKDFSVSTATMRPSFWVGSIGIRFPRLLHERWKTHDLILHHGSQVGWWTYPKNQEKIVVLVCQKAIVSSLTDNKWLLTGMINHGYSKYRLHQLHNNTTGRPPQLLQAAYLAWNVANENEVFGPPTNRGVPWHGNHPKNPQKSAWFMLFMVVYLYIHAYQPLPRGSN